MNRDIVQRRRRKQIRIWIAFTLSAMLAAIVWTNESLDYASKLGFTNIKSSYVMLITTFLFAAAFNWGLMELYLK